MNLIFLTGMPGAGKTYWGRLVAAAYGCQFIDMDEYIEAIYKKDIPHIFKEEGEEAFRIKEKEALHQIIDTATGNIIIACGGGTPVFFDNLQVMKESGCVLYLKAKIETVLSRLEENKPQRPLFQNAGELQKMIETLLQNRAVFFEQADYILPTENISVLTFEEIICACINRQ